MYKLKATLLLLLVLYTGILQAQRKPFDYSMFWNTASLFNPAVSGVSYKYYGAIALRDQWTGFEDNPTWGSIIYDMKLKPLHGGIGINQTHGILGINTYDEFKVNYNYQINFNNKNILSLGITNGIGNNKIDQSQFNIGGNDPLLNNTDVYLTSYLLNLGVFYKTKHLELGLSAWQDYTYNKDNKSFDKSSNVPLFLLASYQFDLGKNFNIKPNAMITSIDLSENTYYTNITVTFKKRFWTGITYIFDNNFGIMAGYDIVGKFRIGYCFDLMNDNVKYNYGSHEIMTAVMF